MIQTKSAGGVVLNPKGEVIIVSQHGTSWSLPKGHVEEGEDSLSAARREIYEESGVRELELITALGSYGRHRIGRDGGEDRSELKTIELFLFRTRQTSLSPVDAENPEALWVGLEEVAELLTHPKDREFFLSVIEIIRGQIKGEAQA
jgi:ADP-ribose pyrophosphatase YjhB (NUDIX family)